MDENSSEIGIAGLFIVGGSKHELTGTCKPTFYSNNYTGKIVIRYSRYACIRNVPHIDTVLLGYVCKDVLLKIYRLQKVCAR